MYSGLSRDISKSVTRSESDVPLKNVSKNETLWITTKNKIRSIILKNIAIFQIRKLQEYI